MAGKHCKNNLWDARSAFQAALLNIAIHGLFLHNFHVKIIIYQEVYESGYLFQAQKKGERGCAVFFPLRTMYEGQRDAESNDFRHGSGDEQQF